MSASPELAIETIALTKRYAQRHALDGLSLTVARGEIFGFLGPNGAGKTTAVKVLLGLTHPTSGAAEILGAPLRNRVMRRRVGYLPELFRYQEWLRAREVLAFHARLIGIPARCRTGAIGSVLDDVGLATRADERVGSYSKGMQQRLGLAVALLGEPELIFLDEPTSALDPLGRHDVRALIERLKRRGATVFLNSHLLGEAERVCDRIAVVDGGRVVASGSVAELVGRAATARVRVSHVGPAAADVLTRSGAHAETPLPNDGAPVWYTLPLPSPEAMPQCIAALAAAGAAIHAALPMQATLEDRFIELLR